MADVGAAADLRAFTRQARGLTADAAAVLNGAFGLAGLFGRYAVQAVKPTAPSEADALLQGAQARAVVETAAAAVLATVNGTGSLPDAIQALLDALGAAQPNPADRLRGFGLLAAATGGSLAALLCRRLSVVALAQAAAAYAPTSYDDAVAVLQGVTDTLDGAIAEAGDAGDDASYGALRGLRGAVVADLMGRGGSLAPLVTRTFASNLPAQVLAARLYGDATRADDVVRRVDPIHPLFMPVTIMVLGR